MDEDFKITSNIKKEQWSIFVANHPKGNIFQTPEMYEVYKNTKNYEPIFVAAIDENNQILGTLLAVVQKEFKGWLGRFSARSVIWGDPLTKETENKKEITDFILREYDKIAKKKALYSQFRNLWDMNNLKNIFAENGYKYEEHLNFLIDLNKSDKELFDTLDKRRRYGIRKAKERNVAIREANDHLDLQSAYSLLQQTYKAAKLPLANFSLFENAFKILYPKGMIKIFIAHKNKTDIATIFLLIYDGIIHDWYAGASSKHLNLYPNDLTTWHAIKYAATANQKYHTFDFGGAGKPNEPYGPRQFKKEFGGKMVNFGRYKKVHSPKKLWLTEKGFEIWRHFRL